MPEYLAPGVYIEEVSFRSKSIEGVSTSTAGFIGPTRFGPISGDPELLTSFADFERIYGGLEDLTFDGGSPTPNYLAHGVRAFFEEGGRRLYVMRVFNGLTTDSEGDLEDTCYGLWRSSSSAPSTSAPVIRLKARFPGSGGNMQVRLALRVGTTNVLTPGEGGARTLTRVQNYDLVHVRVPAAPADPPPDPPFEVPSGISADGLMVAVWNASAGVWTLEARDVGVSTVTVSDVDDLPANAEVRLVTILVEVMFPTSGGRFEAPQSLGEYPLDPRRGGASLTETFVRNPQARLQALTLPFAIEILPDGAVAQNQEALFLARRLFASSAIGNLLRNRAPVEATLPLTGGADGDLPASVHFEGDPDGILDYVGDAIQHEKNGLLAFEGVEDISILVAPGYTTYTDDPSNLDPIYGIQNALINHCEKMRYRVAVLDTPPDYLATQALAYRNQRSSTHAAIYFPWVFVSDPTPGRGGRRLKLPPSAFIAGIYARNDVEHAVFKAPANEVVRLAIDFEQRLNKAHQELLNPEGVNCLRFFEGRGYLVWGARTISDDPEWKYVSLRRYFAYLERSIERGTQWAVFENNGPQLWQNVRQTIEDFLFNEWKMGALLGDKPEKAYFVRCDLSTMTQNDLDNGRLVCLIGVSVVRPAEFVIFRIGQWTANSPR